MAQSAFELMQERQRSAQAPRQESGGDAAGALAAVTRVGTGPFGSLGTDPLGLVAGTHDLLSGDDPPRLGPSNAVSGTAFEVMQQRVAKPLRFDKELTASDRFGEAISNWERQIPYLASALEAKDLYGLWDASKALEAGTATDEQEALVFEYLDRLQAPKTLGYKVVDILAQIVPFVGEMAGGVAVGRKVLGKTVAKALAEAAEKGATRTLAQRLVAGAAKTGAIVGTEAAVSSAIGAVTGGPMGGRITADAYRRAIAKGGMQLNEDEAGRLAVTFQGTVGDFMDSLPQAVASQVIEVGSELAGGALLKGASKVPGLAKVAAAQNAVYEWWRKSHPKGTTTQFLEMIAEKGGWHGPIGEYLEERAGATARALTPGMEEGFGDIFPSLHDQAAELIAFSIPTGVGFAAEAVDQRLTGDAATLPVAEEVAQQPGSATETVPDGAESAGQQGTGVADEVAQLDPATIPDAAAPMGRAEGKEPQRVVHAAEIRGSLRRKRFETASKLLERFGVRAVPVQAEGGGSLAQPAMAGPAGVVFFDVNAAVGERRDRGQGEFQGRAYHEAIHELAGFDAETYQGLQAAIESAVPQEIRDAVLSDYRERLGQEIPESIRDEEMVANLTEGLAPLLVLADKSHGPALLERIARNDFGLFQKILDALKTLSNRVAGTEFKTAAEQALRAWAGVDAKNITPAEAANAALLVNQALQALTGRQAPSIAQAQAGAEAPSESSQSLDEGAAEAPATPIGKPLPGRAADLPSTFTATQEAKTRRKLQRAERAARRLREQAEKAAPEEAAKLRARAVYQDQRAKDYRDQLGTDADLKVGEQAREVQDEAARRRPYEKDMAPRRKEETRTERAKRIAEEGEEDPSKFAAAYHGSPHMFDRFDLSKIGTGEGVQVFGYGLYFASKKEIAEHYKKALGGVEGRGYQVELAPAEDEYLLWDASLAEQSPMVRVALERLGVASDSPQPKGWYWEDPDGQNERGPFASRQEAVEDAEAVGGPYASDYVYEYADPGTGERSYRRMADRAGSDRAASEALLAAGIRGIKYLDGTSRNKGEGSYNYVLFSDQDVEIVDRFAAKGTPKVGAKRVFAGFDVADETKRDAIRRKIQDEFLRIKRIEEAARKQGADIPFEKSAYEAASSAQSRTRGATSRFERRHVAPLIRTLQALVTGGVSMEQAERYLYARHAPSRNREIARRREQARLDSATSDMRRILSDAASDGISPDLVSEHARNSRKTTKKAADRNAEIEAQAERPQRLKNLSEKYALASKGKAQESVRYAEASPSEQAAMVAELARANEGDGSGMATSEANRVVAAAESSEQAALYKKLGEQMDRMIQASLKERLDGGLISQDYYDQLESQWDHYVPLKSDVEGGAFGRGSGFQIRGKEFKRAEGRGSEAESIIAHAIQQGVEGISRAERNRVGLAFLRMLRDNPGVTNWSETRPAEPVDARLLSEREFSLKENGQQIIMEFEDPKTIRALKKMGQEQFGPILRVMRRAAGMWSQLNTTLSPDFVLTNLIRDLGTAGINLTSEQSAALAGMSLKNVPKAARGMYRYLTESEKGGEWAEAAELFAKEGGMVGWFYMPTIQEIQRKITGKLDEVDPTTGKRALMAATAAKDWIETLNQSLENGVRLASFKALVDSGTAPGKAASIARRLTVDFTRKGELSPVLNTLYIFSNASVQGTATMLRVLNTRRGKQFAVGLAGVGVSLAYLGVMAGGDDEDGYSHYSKVPEWIRERNLVLMDPRGTGDYIKVPLPQGWNVFFGLGEKAAMASMGEMTTKDAAKGTFASAFEAFVPLGGETSPAQFASPTLLDPVVQQLENRTFYGGKIKPEQSQYGPTVPESELYFKSVSAASKGLAQWLNRISGGDEVQPGFLDVSPELIDHYAEFVGGSAGASLKRGLVDLPSKVLQGEAPAINEIPVVRRFLGESPEWWTSSTYYDHRNAIERLELRVENAREKGRPQEANALRRENRALWRLRGPMEAVDKQIRELRKRAKTAPDKRQEALEHRIKALQMRFNKLAKESLDAVE